MNFVLKKAASRRAVMWAVFFVALALWSAGVMKSVNQPPREAGRLAQIDAQARWEERAALLEYESPAYDPTQGDAEAYRASSEAAP
ncbi:TPA: hypothetical protein WIT46_000226 [Neisseria meningitidis]|uniref:hypothetical protein n=1 Tax=Neisseria lactamica TaxID=486 RepID=UPI000E5874ED|nr:hypothetical protein [Neisseria lactamica]